MTPLHFFARTRRKWKNCIAPNQFLRSRTRKGPRLRREDPPPGWGEGIGGGVLLSMAVSRSRARLVSSRAGAFAWLALCWCWRRWLVVPGLCLAGGAGGLLPALRMGGRVCLARWRWRWCCSSAGGSGLRRAGMLRRRSATPADTHGPRRHDRPRLRRGPAHHAAALRLCHRRTPRRKRPRPAAEGIYRARSRLPVSYANMPPIIPQPVQSAQKIAADFCAKIIPRPPKGGPWEGISAY